MRRDKRDKRDTCAEKKEQDPWLKAYNIEWFRRELCGGLQDREWMNVVGGKKVCGNCRVFLISSRTVYLESGDSKTGNKW